MTKSGSNEKSQSENNFIHYSGSRAIQTMGGRPRPFFVAFIVLFYYISVGGGGDYPQRVTGVIGETSELVFLQKFTHCPKEIVFKFNRGSETFKIAQFKDKKLQTELFQFQNRLEILRDGMGLLIKNVSFN
ncbi:hypothetical protein AB205_0020410, partial [Aquarana catesbeiana]